jgi:hypothetical protein
VDIDGNPAAFELVLELHGPGLVVKPGDHDAPQLDPPLAQVVDQLHRVGVVRDAEVGPHLFPFDGPGMDAQQDLGLVLELCQQTHLDVGVVAGQHASGVIVEQEFPAELQVQFIAKAAHAFENRRGLLFQVLPVVKADSILHRWLLASVPV